MNPNSSLIWLPKIEAAGLPTPKTIVVPYSHEGILPIFDGQPSPEMDRLLEEVRNATALLGGTSFIRTDLASAKHSGIDACRISGIGTASRALFDTIEDNEMKFWLGDSPRAILVRQFLSLEYKFTAFHGLPIAREWRFFADSARVICFHPYWPEGAFDRQRELPQDWRALLGEFQRETEDFQSVHEMAIKAAAAQDGGEWSVDFCRDVDGKWWLTDMSTAKESWHWEDCPNNGVFK